MDFSLRSTYKALCNQDPPLCYYYTLGYLRCRSFPHKMPSSPPPPQKKYCYHYSIQVTIPEKSSDATWSVHTLQNFSKLCLKMHQIASQGIFTSKTLRVCMPPDPPGKLVAFGHSGLKHSPPNDKSYKEPCQEPIYILNTGSHNIAISQPTQPLFLGFLGFGGKWTFLRVRQKQKKQSILSTRAILLFLIDPSYLPFSLCYVSNYYYYYYYYYYY